PIDDARVVQRVGDDHVPLPQQGLEQSPVGVEAGGVEDGVVCPQETRKPRLQLAVEVLGPADEANGGHPEAATGQRLLCRLNELVVVSKPQISVSAKIEDLPARSPLVLDRDARPLRPEERLLLLPHAAPPDLLEDGLI